MSIFSNPSIKIKSKIRNYYVFFVDDFTKSLTKEFLEKSFFMIDQKIFNLHEKKFKKLFSPENYLIIEATEARKTLVYINTLIKLIIAKNFKRDNKIIAIGGGLIHDIAGFTSSILFRGVEWICYPTTLLAQCDSCIGSKTSINVGNFKNQVGTFFPPSQIILDANFLKTLTKEEMKSGMGEIIKVHFLDGRESFEYIKSHFDEAFVNPALIRRLIFRSLMIKKKIIEKDEFDKNYRNILNYGHTFGHAIESVTNYKIPHGQAITIGMDLTNYISLKKGFLSKKGYGEMREILLKNYPNYPFKDKLENSFFLALAKDKKNIGKDLSAILTEGPGKMKKVKIPFDDNFKRIIYDFQKQEG